MPGTRRFACSSPHWHPPGKPLGPTMHLERLSLPSQRAQIGHANRKVGPGVSQGGAPAFQENSAFPEVEVDSGVTEDQQHPAVADGREGPGPASTLQDTVGGSDSTAVFTLTEPAHPRETPQEKLWHPPRRGLRHIPQLQGPGGPRGAPR